MTKSGIYNLRSIAFTKDFYKFSNNVTFDIDKNNVKLNNAEYVTDINHIKMIPFDKDSYYAKLQHSDIFERYKIKIKHSIFNVYITKYKLRNLYLISNIESFYLTAKYFIKVWNDKNYANNENLVHLNHDSIFYILKYYEQNLYDIEKFQISKPIDIFTNDLLYQLKQF